MQANTTTNATMIKYTEMQKYEIRAAAEQIVDIASRQVGEI